MPVTTRRRLLAGSAALIAAPNLARAEDVKPRLTIISQWSAGSDGAAISALGKLFEQHGGVWQHNPVPGFTTEMMNKLRAQIQMALKQVSPELREAVILRDLEDMDYKEIAEVLGVPQGTVKSRISRGRAELARLLKGMEGQVMQA